MNQKRNIQLCYSDISHFTEYSTVTQSSKKKQKTILVEFLSNQSDFQQSVFLRVFLRYFKEDNSSCTA